MIKKVLLALMVIVACGAPAIAGPLNLPTTLASSSSTASGSFFLPDYQAPVSTPEAPLWLTGLGVLAKLAIVLGLAYGSLGLYKKYIGQRGFTLGGTADQAGGLKGMRVLESISLCGTQHLYLVALGDGRQVVVGSNGSQLLVKLAELAPLTSTMTVPGSATFKAQLDKAQQPLEDFQGELAATLREVLFEKENQA